MKPLGIALLALSGSSHACEQLFWSCELYHIWHQKRLWSECCMCFYQTYKILYESRL